MGRLLTQYGEEYLILNGLDSGATAWSVGLYDDAAVGTTGDSVVDGSDLAAITTEPAGAAYARQTSTFSPSNEDGDATGLLDSSINDSLLSFDVSDSTGTVDSWFLVINFTATGDASATDHLIATGPLSKERDLSQIDTLDISAGGVGATVE